MTTDDQSPFFLFVTLLNSSLAVRATTVPRFLMLVKSDNYDAAEISARDELSETVKKAVNIGFRAGS